MFVSQDIKQQVFKTAEPLANALRRKGKLTLIAIGHIDQRKQYIPKLADTFVFWPDPNLNQVLLDWYCFLDI